MHRHVTAAMRGVISAALAAAALGTASVQAAPTEQVSRLDGTSSFFSGESSSAPLAVSDGGRYAAFSTSTPSTTSYSPGQYEFYVRDIQANRTQPLGQLERVFGFDHAERSVLGSRRSGENISLVLFSLTGGPEQVLWTGKRGFRFLEALLSGDGNTVIFDDAERNRAVSMNVATGAQTVLQVPLDDGVSLGSGTVTGLSDDGRTAAITAPIGYTGTYATKVYRAGQLVRTIPGQGLLTPDGTAFASVPRLGQSNGSPRILTVTNVSSGNAKTFPVPGDPYADPIWTSTSGARVVMRVGGTLQQVEWATGTWSSFGGRYAGDVFQIARSGRFATVSVRGRHVALVDLTDAELAGGGDAWSPDVYLDTSESSYTCRATPPFYLDRTCALKRRVKLVTPAAWLPAPKRAAVTIRVGGLQLASGTLLLGQTLAGNYNFPTVNSTTSATVTDFLGRQRTMTWTTYHGG